VSPIGWIRETLADHQERQEEKRQAREQERQRKHAIQQRRREAERRRRAEEEEARRVRLGVLVARGMASVWREVETEVERRSAAGYERAVGLLRDLQVLAEAARHRLRPPARPAAASPVDAPQAALP